jgi:hypothetical protein
VDRKRATPGNQGVALVDDYCLCHPFAVDVGSIARSQVPDTALRAVALYGEMLAGEIGILSDCIVGLRRPAQAQDGACSNLNLSARDGTCNGFQYN